MLEYHKEDEALLVRNLVTGQDLLRHPPPSSALTPSPPIPLPTQHNPSRNALLPPNLPPPLAHPPLQTPPRPSPHSPLCPPSAPHTHTLPTLTLSLTPSPHAAAFLMSSWVTLWFVWGLPSGAGMQRPWELLSLPSAWFVNCTGSLPSGVIPRVASTCPSSP